MDDPGSGAWATGEAINKAGNVVGGAVGCRRGGRVCREGKENAYFGAC